MQLNNCIAHNVLCRDPPATTSALLRRLGLSEYHIRRFWSIAKNKIKNKSNTVTIFKHRNVLFKVEFEIRLGSSCLIEPAAYIDEFDCQEVMYARQITNLNMLYVYLKGYVNNELFIKINGVYLLKKLMDLGEVNSVNSIRTIAKRMLEKSFSFNDLTHVNNLVSTLLRFNRELKEIIIYVPKNDDDFLRLIPPLMDRFHQKIVNAES